MHDEIAGSASHSRDLRRILRDARERLKLSAEGLGERIAAELERYDAEDPAPPHPNTVYAWEKFRRHPNIDRFAAWARALGYRLVVELVEVGSAARAIMVRTDEAAEAARRIDRLDTASRKRVIDAIRMMTPGQDG